MDLRQMQYEPQSDLESLKKNIDRGFDDETEQFCKFLARKYDQSICWIKQKEAIENFQLLEKDKLGQMLIPEDIILGEENRFLACKATGNGDCLFNSTSRILVGNESLHFFLRLLTTLELYTNSTFYAKHPAFQEYAGGVENGYDEDTLFTLCLTAEGMAKWQDGNDRMSAIKGEAKRCSKKQEWCGIFHLMALASILGRPLYSVYPNAGSALRELLHRKINPRVLDQDALDTIYIMWSRDGALDSDPGRCFQPNHFIPIFKVPPQTDSNLRMPAANQGVIGSKTLPIKNRQTKMTITNFFSKVDEPPPKTVKRPNNGMNSESCPANDLKGARTKKINDIQGNSEAADE